MSMTDDLLSRAASITAELKLMSASKAGGLPNVNQSNGAAKVDHVEYRLSLYKELDGICKVLGLSNTQQLDELLAGGDPNTFESQTEITG